MFETWKKIKKLSKDHKECLADLQNNVVKSDQEKQKPPNGKVAPEAPAKAGA